MSVVRAEQASREFSPPPSLSKKIDRWEALSHLTRADFPYTVNSHPFARSGSEARRTKPPGVNLCRGACLGTDRSSAYQFSLGQMQRNQPGRIL